MESPLKNQSTVLSPDYSDLLDQLKSDIQKTQLKAALSVTKELIGLYWRIGRQLALKVEKAGGALRL